MLKQSRSIKAHSKDIEGRAGLASLLGFAFVLDDIVVMKDGALQAVFRFNGDDVQSVVDEMRVAYALRWSQAVASIWTENIMIEHDIIRQKAENYSKGNTFDEIVPALIDQERQYQFEHAGQMFESITYVSITYRDAKQISKRTKKFIYNTEDQAREKTATERLHEFKNKLNQFVRFVAYGNKGKFDRLSGDDLTSFYYNCITAKKQRLLCPDSNTFLDTYLAKDDFLAGHLPKIGKKTVKILGIDNYPAKVHPMMMHILNTLPIEFRYHTRYALLSKSQAASELKTLQKTWSSKAIGMKGVVIQSFGGTPQLDEAAQSKNFETQDCIAENEEGDIKYGFYSGVFVFMDEDKPELNRRVTDFIDTVQNLGFVLRDEMVNGTEAYLGSIPGHGNYNCRMNPLDSISWAYQLPISNIYSGEVMCPNPYYPKGSSALLYAITDDTNVYRLNIQVKDVGHVAALGPTGGGKSTLIQLMAAQHTKYTNHKIICLDKDASSKYSILAMGGKYYDPSDLSTHKIAPFTQLSDTHSFEITNKWLCDTFEINGVLMDANRRMEVFQSLERLAKLDAEHRKFSNLEFQEKALRDAYRNLKSGSFGEIMDGTEDHLLESNIVGIDIGELLKLDARISTPIIKCLLNKIDLAANRKIPTLLFIEEGWMILDNPTYRGEVKNWLKTMRKKVVSIIFISQSLSDISNSEIRDVILESCPTKIYLPNEQAHTEIVRGQYLSFGLNEKEIDLIAEATPKQHYYVTQPAGKRLIDLNIGEVTLAFIGISSDESIKKFNKHFDENNPQWVVGYLKECGLKDAAKYALEHFFTEETA